MRTLKAPNENVFCVSLILVFVAWMSVFLYYIGEHPLILLTFAYLVLCIL
jgi:hypothetical protein